MIRLNSTKIGFLTSPLALPMGELRMKSGGAKTSTRATASSFNCLKTKDIHLATSEVVYSCELQNSIIVIFIKYQIAVT